MGVGITTDLFLAGFAMTVEFASTHSEVRTARKLGVFAKRGFRSMAGSALVPSRDDAVREAREQVSGASSFKAQTVCRALRDKQIEIDSGTGTPAGACM